MSINQRKVGAFLSYISIFLNNVIGLIYTPVMLRMMGQSEYGLFSLVSSVVSYLTVLDLGFANAIIRYTAKFRAEEKIKEQYEMFGMFFIIYVGIGFVALLCGGGLYLNIDVLFDHSMSKDEISKIQIMMLLMIFNIAFTFPMSIWGAIITAYENFVFSKIVNIVRIILNPIVMLIMLWLGYRAIGMVVVITVFNVISLFINWWYCRKVLHIQLLFGHFKWDFFREVSVYSCWIFFNVIIDRIYWNTGQFVLGMFKGTKAVATYALAIQLHTIYMGFSMAIYGVLLPKITGMVTKKCSDIEISALFLRISRLQYIILVFVLTGFVIFGKAFVIFWAGIEYYETYYIALCLFIPFTIPLVQNIGTLILQAKNQMKFRTITYLLIAVMSLFFSIPLAKKMGGLGCAIGTSTAIFIGHIIIMNIYYYKKLNIDILTFWRQILQMSVIPFIIASMFIMINQFYEIDSIYKLLCEILIFILIYIPMFYRYALNSYEVELLKLPMRRFFRTNEK